MTERVGRLFPVGGPVPPDLVIGRAGDIDELERRVSEELNTILVGPRRIGKTTVCEAVCDRVRQSGAAVVSIEMPERPDSRALLQLMIDRCSRLSHEARGRRAAQVARPLIEKLLADLGVPLDLSVLASDAVLPTREVLALPVRLAGATERPVLVFFDELQRVVDYADGEQLLIDIVDVYSASRGISVLVDGSEERTLDAMLGAPTHLGKLCDRVTLDPRIPLATWREPLRERFGRAGQTIESDALEALIAFGDGRPTQQWPQPATRPSAHASSTPTASAASRSRWALTRPAVTSPTTMPDTASTSTASRLLIGRLAEYQELLTVLDARQGLTVVAADPWSGTSAVMRSAIEEIAWPCVLVDARSCTDALDLAMAIADAAVTTLAPEAAGWWQRLAPPSSQAGLELSRVLSAESIHLEDLQLGGGRAEQRLDEAIRLLVALATPQPATLVIDHAGLLLAGMAAPDSRKLLGDLRSLRQTHTALDLLLIEHPDGEAATALHDTGHPLYQAGGELRLRRPDPARYVDDLAIARPWTDVPIPLLRIAADLAAGVPWLTWQIVDRGGPRDEDPRAQALAGWAAIRAATEPATVREWDLLRRLHPQAQTVIAALAAGLKPHSIAANSKSVSDALRRLNGAGLAWQPEPRRWAGADPLLAAWAREHSPPWIHRRRGTL